MLGAHPDHLQQFRPVVIAIIKAMREPTEDMNRAGTDEISDVDYSDGSLLCDGIWRAMIDAALEDAQ